MARRSFSCCLVEERAGKTRMIEVHMLGVVEPWDERCLLIS